MHLSVAPVDVTPALRPERTALLALLGELSADDWARPTECPGWSVQDIALHVLGDDLSLLSRQRDAATNSLMLFAADHPGLSFRALLDGSNEQWVTAARFFSSALVIELLRLVGDWSESFYAGVGLEAMSSEPVGFFGETGLSPFWQVIAREYVERFTHQSQIRRAVGANELSPELTTAAATATVHALAAWIKSYAPAPGSAIALDFGEVGAWTYARATDGWAVIEGIGDTAPDARITVNHGAIGALLSRGLTQETLDTVLTLGGDETLARGALDIIVPIIARPVA